MDDFQDPATRRHRYQKLAAQLWTDRSTFDAHWRDLGDFFLPGGSRRRRVRG